MSPENRRGLTVIVLVLAIIAWLLFVATWAGEGVKASGLQLGRGVDDLWLILWDFVTGVGVMLETLADWRAVVLIVAVVLSIAWVMLDRRKTP